MRISILFSFLLLFSLLSCEKEMVQEDQAVFMDEQVEFRGRPPVPFRVSYVSTALVFPPEENPAVCNGLGAPVLNFTQTLEGNATHMGNISGGLSSCINFANGQIFNVELTLIAANGDELYLETDDGTQGATFMIVGGTGRFTEATGSATGTFEQIPDAFPPMFNTEFEGEIQY